MTDLTPIPQHEKEVVISERPTVKIIDGNKQLNSGVESEVGVINKHIGTGDNAKDSFVWMTLRSCFWIAGLISLGLFLISSASFFINNICSDNALVDNLKNVWSIFTPIITLALGYAFGKRESK